LNAVAPLWTRPAALIMFIRLYGLTTAEGQMSSLSRGRAGPSTLSSNLCDFCRRRWDLADRGRELGAHA